LYTLLTTAIPSVRGGKVFMGDQEVSGDTSEHLSNIRGIAVKDMDLASQVDLLFKQRGYEVKRDYN